MYRGQNLLRFIMIYWMGAFPDEGGVWNFIPFLLDDVYACLNHVHDHLYFVYLIYFCSCSQSWVSLSISSTTSSLDLRAVCLSILCVTSWFDLFSFQLLVFVIQLCLTCWSASVIYLNDIDSKCALVSRHDHRPCRWQNGSG